MCFIVNSLIVFSNTIRLSTDSLILWANTLIVAERTMRQLKQWRYTLFPVSYFCVVTSSRCHDWGITAWKCPYCVRDNGVTTKSNIKFVVTHLNSCLPMCLLCCDNVTTKNWIFLVGERKEYSFNACSATPLPDFFSIIFQSFVSKWLKKTISIVGKVKGWCFLFYEFCFCNNLLPKSVLLALHFCRPGTCCESECSSTFSYI